MMKIFNPQNTDRNFSLNFGNSSDFTSELTNMTKRGSYY